MNRKLILFVTSRKIAMAPTELKESLHGAAISVKVVCSIYNGGNIVLAKNTLSH
jgi:hypothetical protein